MSITVYSKEGCVYCVDTKMFLKEIGIPYTEIKLESSDVHYTEKRDCLFNTFGHRSFPVILIGNALIGGYKELLHSYSTLQLHKLCQDIGITLEYDF